MALAEVAYHVFAGSAYVGKDANRGAVPGYCETVRFLSIMPFRESMNAESANVNRIIGIKRLYKLRINPQPAVSMGCGRYVNGNIIFAGNHFRAAGMIGMFM